MDKGLDWRTRLFLAGPQMKNAFHAAIQSTLIEKAELDALGFFGNSGCG